MAPITVNEAALSDARSFIRNSPGMEDLRKRCKEELIQALKADAFEHYEVAIWITVLTDVRDTLIQRLYSIEDAEIIEETIENDTLNDAINDAVKTEATIETANTKTT